MPYGKRSRLSVGEITHWLPEGETAEDFELFRMIHEDGDEEGTLLHLTPKPPTLDPKPPTLDLP